ncbi:MAG: hypothetical protein H7210_14920 [Pyrinomonadaceae bacterium]|nr:hypothetical protein [Phycisphaerales bacterium]
MTILSRPRSLTCTAAMLVLTVVAVVKVAIACSHAPPQPPVVCITRLDATHYCILIKNYNTGGGAQQGQFCTCALRQLGPIVSVDAFHMLRCGTTIPVPGWNFVANSVSSQAWSQLLGGPATGFASAVQGTVPPETCLDLKFIVTVASGTTTAQMVAALSTGAPLVGNGEADPNGRPRQGSFEIRPAGPVMVVTPPCIADFNGDGEITSQDFFAFLTAFFNNSADADVNNDGVISSQDFFDFIAAFFNGC